MYTRDPHTFKYVHIFKFAYWFIGRYILTEIQNKKSKITHGKLLPIK